MGVKKINYGNEKEAQEAKEFREKDAAMEAKRQASMEASTVNKQIEDVKKQKASEPSSTQTTPTKQKEVTCPFCASHVKKKDVTGGRAELRIPFFDPPWRIPIPPFLAKLIQPKPDKCICQGRQKIKDVADDSTKYQQLAQKAQANIEKSIDLEAQMGTGGMRTTYIEKSDTLFVGLGFNRNDSYEVVPKGQLNPGKLTVDPPGFPAGYESNAVVGKQTSAGWPSAVGNYKIVCANSFNVTAGAGGIQLNTKGPLTFNSGILNLTGPQVNVGSSSGPLTLEGDTVSISGKTISLTPTDANVFVKGTISTTGNVVIGGQLHAETLSFSKASCPARDERTSTNASNPDVTQTMSTTWGGPGVKAIISSILDIQAYFGNVVTNFETAALSILSPQQQASLTNRFTVLAKESLPLEPMITGVCFTAVGPGIVINFPHLHGVLPMQHDHGIRIPDIECKDYASPQAVRAAVVNESLTSNAPAKKKTTAQELIQFALRIPGFVANAGLQIQKAIRWVVQLF